MAKTSYYLAATVGICVGLAICVVALVIFVIVFCRVKIKDDSNTRKRLITNGAFDSEKQQTRPEPILEERFEPPPPPIIVQPLPPPPPQPVYVPIRPRRVMPVIRSIEPPPQPQPIEQRVIIREIVREREPQPLQPQPQPQPAPQRNVPNPDEWMLVKRIRKRNNNRRAISDDEDDDDDEEEETVCNRRRRCGTRRHKMQQMRGAYPRLEPYDLATPAGIYGPRPGMFGLVPQATGAIPVHMMAATAAPAAQNYIPFPVIMQPTM